MRAVIDSNIPDPPVDCLATCCWWKLYLKTTCNATDFMCSSGYSLSSKWGLWVDSDSSIHSKAEHVPRKKLSLYCRSSFS
mmetsp:Transcript_39329/g.95180  ORF Transcript_39329/g.95180 Transcript_39329/m.95180 type:complete len:80 (-) Transcript_39329:135-374(-)